MAKYTIISLILTDFVPIFFIFNLFQKNLGGHSLFKKSQVDFRGEGGGGVKPIFKKSQVKKNPNHARGEGGSSPLQSVSQVSPLVSLESFP